MIKLKFNGGFPCIIILKQHTEPTLNDGLPDIHVFDSRDLILGKEKQFVNREGVEYTIQTSLGTFTYFKAKCYKKRPRGKITNRMDGFAITSYIPNPDYPQQETTKHLKKFIDRIANIENNFCKGNTVHEVIENYVRFSHPNFFW